MAPLLFLIMFLGVSTLGVTMLVKRNNQNQKDQDRKYYRITFPQDLEADRIISWVRSVSGTLRGSPWMISGHPTLAFEVRATTTGIEHYIRVPWQHADYVVSQLRSLAPGINVAPVERPAPTRWTRAVEVGMTNPSRPLRISSPCDVSTSILASMQALKDGEVILMQWVVMPAVPERLPDKHSASNEFRVSRIVLDRPSSSDEVTERRTKLAEPNVLGLLRLAAAAQTDVRADHLVRGVRAALSAVRTPHNRWVKRMGSTKAIIVRLERAAAPVTFPAQLSALELASLIAWPIGSPHVAGLPRGRAQNLPTPSTVQRVGRIIGDSNFPGDERPIAVSPYESCKHFHIVGRTGSGKTVLATALAAQDIHAGRGVIVIDPKFDLFEGVSQMIPSHRLKDVVIFDVSDQQSPVGYNMLSQGSPQTVASEIQGIFDNIYKDVGAVRMPEVLYHVLITLMTTTAKTTPYTFIDIIPLLWPTTPEDHRFSKAVIKGVKDPYIKSWWDQIDKLSANEKAKYFQSLRSRVWQLNSRPEIRRVIGQSETSIDMRDIVANRKILLVNLKGLPQEVAAMIGSHLVNNFGHVLKEGLSSQENPVSLYLDEFQNFVHSPIKPEQMLAEWRSFGAAIHLMHQGLDQLAGRAEVRSAAMNNAVNKIVMQRGNDDARAFAGEFGPPIKDEDFKRLGQYEFIARVMSDDGISPPITGRTRPPLEPFNLGHQARELSRQKHGKSVQQVEDEIVRRRQIGRDGDAEAPIIGVQPWD